MLIFAKKIDSDIFEGKKANFLNLLYALRCNNRVNFQNYKKIEKGSEIQFGKIHSLLKTCLKILKKNSIPNNIQVLKTKHFELFVDHRMKYVSVNSDDVLLDK